jgi:hypothetical protein
MDLNTALLSGPDALVNHYSEEIAYFARSKANPGRATLSAEDLARIAEAQVVVGFYSLADKSDIQYIDSFFRRCIRNSILGEITKAYYQKRGARDVVIASFRDSRDDFDPDGDEGLSPGEATCQEYGDRLAPTNQFYETIGNILRILPDRFHAIFLTLIDAEFGNIHEKTWAFLAKRLDMSPYQFAQEVKVLREVLGPHRDIIFSRR